ncbi:hypothetical protein FOZ60_007740 [Perkinsus olseni]|uniref:RING-type domain-containing protein n=1 Tax=Perkinsus olseni TaxID=32597 RepID=A0A7J6NLU8_PEROL|nr:hypothetical protein FOZ60_007740 [Perkinsus olseni]
MNVSVLSSELSSPLPQQGPPSPSSKSGFRRASAGSRMSFVRSSTREALSVRDVAGGSWGENDGMSPVSEEASVAVPNASAPMSPESEAPGEGPPEGVARPELQSQSSSGGRSSRRRSTGRRRTSTQRRSRSHISRSSTGTIAVLDEESGLCKVCFENATNTVLLPCKHQCMCLDCAAGSQRQHRLDVDVAQEVLRAAEGEAMRMSLTLGTLAGWLSFAEEYISLESWSRSLLLSLQRCGQGEGRAFLGFTLGAAGVPRTTEISCPELDGKKMFSTVFRNGVVQEFTLGAPNKRKDSDWVFKDPPPPAGTAMDPLRKLNTSYYDRQLTLLRAAASKVDYNPAKLRRAIVKAENLRASGRDGDITADKIDGVCEAAMRGIKAKCPSYEDLCDEFRSISQEAVDAADQQRRRLQRAGKYLVISL